MPRNSVFLDKLVVTNIKNGWWRVEDDMRYLSKYHDKPIIVPAGFVTDFASVPRLPLIYLLFGNRGFRPATVHDYLYRYHIFSQKKCDKVFLESMKAEDYSVFTRYPMYWAVRIFGDDAYYEFMPKMDPR